MGRPPTISHEQILQAARAVFTDKGFAGATLADIAAELHVTPAAVLRHFQSKEALFGAAMRGSVALPECITRLERIDASTDPRVVLRQVAHEWLPFASTRIGQNVVVSMHARSNPTLVMPFDPRSADSPARRGLKIVADYFRRAKAAGVVHVDDPRAAALLFMGSLLSYVFIHQVLRIVEPPYPVDDYVDALLDLWTEGAIGGTDARQKQTDPADRPRRRDRGRRGRGAAVRPPAGGAPQSRAVRNAGSTNRRSGLSRRRPRKPDLHR